MRENDQPNAAGRHFIGKIVKSLKTNFFFFERGLHCKRRREEGKYIFLSW